MESDFPPLLTQLGHYLQKPPFKNLIFFSIQSFIQSTKIYGTFAMFHFYVYFF